MGSLPVAAGDLARRSVALALALLPLLLLPAVAHAGTIAVTTSFDELAAGDGSCSLREAVQTANTDVNFHGCKDSDASKPDVIKLAGGDYHLSIPGTDDANANGDLDVSESVAIRGLGATATGIDANGDITGDRAIQISAGTLTLQGLTVYDGVTGGTDSGGGILGDSGTVVNLSGVRVNDNSSGFGGGILGDTVKLTNSAVDGNSGDSGGGIVATRATLIGSAVNNNNGSGNFGGGVFATNVNLTKSTVNGNTINGSGGGMYATRVNLTGSTVRSNTATTNTGGGIFGDTVNLTNSSVTGNIAGADGGGVYGGTLAKLTRSTLSDNRANGPNGSGGGFVGGAADLTDSTVSDNFAGRAGGGLYTAGAHLVNSTVVGNKANGTTFPSGGGGIFGGGTLSNSTVIRNRSAEEGGGIFGYAAALTVSHSTIADNEAVANAGGIFFHPVVSKNLSVVDSTLSGNETDAWGGALSTDMQQTTLSSDTITRNVADAEFNDTGDGGGVDVFGSAVVRLRNTILGGNVDRGAQIPDCNGAVTSLGYNLIGSTTGCTVTPTTGDQTGTDASPVNPGLALLGQNGGPTLTSALLGGSPAVNTGNPATPGSGGGACPTTDQRGVPRALDGRCDKGAYELVTCQSRRVNVVGTGGADHLTGTSAADGILGLGGNDTLTGLAGNDGLCGGSGNDHLDGGSGTDSCDGGPGTDTATSCEIKHGIP